MDEWWPPFFCMLSGHLGGVQFHIEAVAAMVYMTSNEGRDEIGDDNILVHGNEWMMYNCYGITPLFMHASFPGSHQVRTQI